MRVVVVGGGAAGFFAAISARQHHPEAEVILLEKSDKLLSKVRISGGGRCNVTHDCRDVRKLASHYPRGGPFLRKAFKHFAVTDTIAWFAERGVALKTEADGRMFPVTDNSNTIVEALMNAAERSGVVVRTHAGVREVVRAEGPHGPYFRVVLVQDGPLDADRVIVCAGGHPKVDAYAWLERLGHSIVQPVPSLFTFNMPDEPVRELMGVVADPARVRIVGTDLESTGPVLITHWGMSGPAVLRLSAWGARALHEMNYAFTVQVNWLGGTSETVLRERMATAMQEDRRKQALNAGRHGLPKRLWAYLLQKAGIPAEKLWGDLATKERNRLIDLLTNDRYVVKGKTTFKEEFVTAGGLSLDDVDPDTLQSRKVPGLYFAGEVLDIDGITGGFNFQAAWTTGHIAGRLG